ncbi:MAG: hypothetical protein LUQ22_06415, partial [Methanotrichaceae archaeon]|nr:hypothetical protein [Methanotrichaceae archaeon]
VPWRSTTPMAMTHTPVSRTAWAKSSEVRYSHSMVYSLCVSRLHVGTLHVRKLAGCRVADKDVTRWKV